MKAKLFILPIVIQASLILAIVILAGCMSDKHPSTRPSGRDRQKEALDDPFGYSPDMAPADISGGKINELDRKAMKKDIDHVLNP